MTVRVLVPTGALGLGYDRDALAAGIAQAPDIIAVDGGSTDSGPHYLGTGTSKYSRASTKAEWRELMAARRQANVPLVIGTAGTCGANDAVDWLADITREIAAETGETLTLALLKSGQTPKAMQTALRDGRISSLPAAPEITDKTFEACTNIVSLAGAEQIQTALATGADVVIAGRTTDTALLAALPLARGCDPGAAWHGAKIGECGAISTTHPGSGTILISFDNAGFTITPMGAAARATPHTVSAHMLYENYDPYILHEPGGHLDVTQARYIALDERQVRVEGSVWVPAETYRVKLEGARKVGYQTVTLALIRDDRYVQNIRAWCADIHEKCTAKVAERLGGAFDLELRVIGLDATLGPLDPAPLSGSEVGVMGICTAPTEAQSVEVAKMLNPYLLHHPLDPQEEMPTFAFPFSPPEMRRGAVYAFCLNHVLELANPMDAFELVVEEITP